MKSIKIFLIKRSMLVISISLKTALMVLSNPNLKIDKDISFYLYFRARAQCR
jgi:hypothetical protein